MSHEIELLVKEALKRLSEPGYREFSQGLIPGGLPLIGVRLPALRRLAKEVAVRSDWQSYLTDCPEQYFEETMLKGMVIGNANLSLEERLSWIAWFVPKIDNWSVCDSFCAGLKPVQKDREQVWGFLQPYLVSEQEFEARFGAVMLLDHYIVPEWIDRVLAALSGVKQPGYYVKMAVGWALSVCYVKFPNQTFPYLTGNEIDPETRKKALQKITESRRISGEQRELIRRMRREIS